VTAIDELRTRKHPLLRPRWWLVRWVGLRWQRRLGWLGVILFGAGPLVAAGFLVWYVHSGALVARLERNLSDALQVPVHLEGLQVRAWGRYRVARVGFAEEPGSSPLLSARNVTLVTSPTLRMSCSQVTVELGGREALARWERLLRTPARAPVQLLIAEVILSGLPTGAAGRNVSLAGELTVGPSRSRAFLYGRTEAGERTSFRAGFSAGRFSCALSPEPVLLGRDRLARLTGVPARLLPHDLSGDFAYTDDGQGTRVHFSAKGTLDLSELARRLQLPEGRGTVDVTFDLVHGLGTEENSYQGSVTVKLAGPEARVDGLALEQLRFILLGELADRAVGHETWTLKELAFQLTCDGDAVTVSGQGTEGAILRAQSDQGFSIELAGSARSSVNELAGRFHLAVGR